MMKSGELVIGTPSLYHVTSGGGFPLTLATNLAEPPSRTRCEWSFSVNCGATPTTAHRQTETAVNERTTAVIHVYLTEIKQQ